jgi:hypothetical protein
MSCSTANFTFTFTTQAQFGSRPSSICTATRLRAGRPWRYHGSILISARNVSFVHYVQTGWEILFKVYRGAPLTRVKRSEREADPSPTFGAENINWNIPPVSHNPSLALTEAAAPLCRYNDWSSDSSQSLGVCLIVISVFHARTSAAFTVLVYLTRCSVFAEPRTAILEIYWRT